MSERTDVGQQIAEAARRAAEAAEAQRQQQMANVPKFVGEVACVAY